MNLGSYLKDKIFGLTLFIFTTLIITILLIFLNAHILLIIYIPFILIFSYLCALLNDYFKRKKFYDNMDKLIKELDKNI